MDGIPPSSFRRFPSLRLFLAVLIAPLCILLLLRACFLEPFQVPTGSMAPTLLGQHRSATCPRCRFVVAVGCSHSVGTSFDGERSYAGVSCPNCGLMGLHLEHIPETSGDQVLVDKSLYGLRRPRRWEVVVFRLFGKTFIKRLIGLSGEEIEVVDGDVYVGGKLARKTFDEFLGMRTLIFDHDFSPAGHGWKERWEHQPEPPSYPSPGEPLMVDGRARPQKLTYRHFSLDAGKCLPIVNEYAYNGGNQPPAEAVHDFMVDADVEIIDGTGRLSIALDDGGMNAEIELGVGGARDLVVRTTPHDAVTAHGAFTGHQVRLLAGKHYHMEVALVDRRLTVRLDGRDACDPLDLPEAKGRAAVVRPLTFHADGACARLSHVRLYRDVHYTQAGINAVRGRGVRLPIDQAFVLGDNSANSVDSRFWPNQGMVPLANVVGRAFLVHLPSRTVTWERWGRRWRYQVPDWDRVRLLP